MQTGSKWAKNTCLCTPNGQGHFWKNTFLTHCSLIFAPKTAHFQGILGFSMGQNPSQWAPNGLKTRVCAPPMVQDHFWKNVFLTHF